jgi:formylmethanofuran dehydrogenase subunit B
LELAEEVGGIIDNTSTVCHGPSILAVQDVGLIGCTLGQIRHRADLIIYWGSNPWSAHPRHMERYAALSDGRFQTNIWKRLNINFRADSLRKKISRITSIVYKKENDSSFEENPLKKTVRYHEDKRNVVVIDVRKTRSADIADYYINIQQGKDYEVLQALRALIRNEELDVENVGGVSIKTLEDLSDMMIECKMGVIFFGLGLTMSRGKHRNIDAAIRLTQDLNTRTKFVILPMRGHFNVSGANTVFTWQTGYPYAVDFSLGYPRYNPGETSVVDILRRGDSDSAIIVASDPISNFPRVAAHNLCKNPLIVIDPHLSPTALLADVVIPSAFVGIETGGTTYRTDHVPLPLKKLVEPPKNCLSDDKILSLILKNVRDLKSSR